MTSIKFKIKKSSVENKKASIYVQLIHRREIRKIFTKQYVYQSEWDEGKGRIRYEMVPRNDRRRFSELKGIEECLNQIYYELDSCIYNLSHGWLSDDYSLEDVVELYQGRKYSDKLLSYGELCCEELKKQNRPRTAEAYLSTIRSVVKFNNGKDVALKQITRTFLKSYEIYLHKRGCQPNTISFYMRMLRAIYNKAVSDRIISMFVESPFQKVFTGMEKTRKRAVDKSVIRQLKNAAFPNEPTLDFARDLFLFSFYTRGMAFVDLAFLRKDSLKQGVLCYRRFKTGQRLRIKVTKPLAELIQKYAEATKEEPYLLPVVSSNLPDTRGQYKKALHNQNRRLKTISERLSIYPYLTSYSPRHSWATIAKKEGLEIPVISEGMGHQSMVTTEIYLAFFDDDVLDQANDLVIAL